MSDFDFDYKDHYKLDAEKFDYFEERYGATEHDERRLREYITSLVPKSTKSILDVGCGSAWVANTFLHKQKKIFSLDISKTNPRKALDMFPSKNHSGITADSFSLPFIHDTFDVVIASEIIEHVISPDKFVEELLRVVKPGGKLFISTPYKEKLQYVLCIHCNKVTPLHAHIHTFDENRLSEYAGDSGFRYYRIGNKALLHLRTYIFLKYLPFFFWKLVDKFANLLLPKEAHIIAEYTKK